MGERDVLTLSTEADDVLEADHLAGVPFYGMEANNIVIGSLCVWVLFYNGMELSKCNVCFP